MLSDYDFRLAVPTVAASSADCVPGRHAGESLGTDGSGRISRISRCSTVEFVLLAESRVMPCDSGPILLPHRFPSVFHTQLRAVNLSSGEQSPF